MKRKTVILIAILVAILLGVFVFSTFLSKYNQVVFLMRHISLYLLVSITILTLIVFLYKQFKPFFSQKNRLQLFNIFTIVIFIGLLYLASILQFNYIEKYDSPLLIHCSYYDEYGNLLYFNHMPTSCDEPVITTDGNETTFLISEEYTGPFTQYWVYNSDTGEDQTFYNGDININLLVQVTVVHDNGKLVFYKINMTQAAIINVDNTVLYSTILREKTVTNTYTSKHFVSTQNLYVEKYLDRSVYNSSINTITDVTNLAPVSSIQYIFDYNEPYGTTTTLNQFLFSKIDLLADNPEAEDIAWGIRKSGEDEFIQISKTGSESGDLGVIRYDFSKDSSTYQIGPFPGDMLNFNSDITREYGNFNNPLVINNLSSTAKDFPMFDYESLDHRSLSIEIPDQKSYSKIFPTDYGFRVESYIDGEAIDEFNEFDYDLSYYYYDFHMNLLNYEDILFDPWPEYHVLDSYRAILDFN